MSSTSKIEWLDGGSTWNPVTGCTPISEGCVNCYAKKMAETRLRGRYGYDQDEPFKVTYHPDKLYQPLKWKKPRMIFVCSMGDLFHKEVEELYIQNMLGVMLRAKQHTFLLLTKRADRMKKYFEKWRHYITSNIWCGVTIESTDELEERITPLLQTPVSRRFISIEPMLSKIDLLGALASHRGALVGDKIGWVICGGETGPNARPMNLEWARDLKTQCLIADIPFFFKKAGNRKETPFDLQTREFPEGILR